MANAITELASVYTHKRDFTKTDAKSDVKPEKAEKAAAEKPVIENEALVSKVENLSQIIRRNIEFSVDDATGQSVVRVVDSDTGELVRQIPSDEILNLISQVEEWREELKTGVLLDVST